MCRNRLLVLYQFGTPVASVRGYDSISIKRELGERVDAFIEDNEWGFTSRSSVVAAALRHFLNQEAGPEETTRAFLERTIKAVALAGPQDVPDLLKALLHELDARSVKPGTGNPKSK